MPRLRHSSLPVKSLSLYSSPRIRTSIGYMFIISSKSFFCTINNYLIDIFYGMQLCLPFYNSLDRRIFLTPVQGRIDLQSCNQVVTLRFSFSKHSYMTSMKEVKGASRQSYSHSYLDSKSHDLDLVRRFCHEHMQQQKTNS